MARLPQSYGKCQIDRCYQRGVSIFREGGQLQVGGWIRGGECQQRDRVDHAVHLLATRRLY